MTTYEAKADDQKTLELTMDYFEGLFVAQEEFEQNVGGPNKRARYESAVGIQEASEEMGAEIRQYMDSLAGRTRLTFRRPTGGCWPCRAICKVSLPQRTSK